MVRPTSALKSGLLTEDFLRGFFDRRFLRVGFRLAI
jgi:hypothetical protein